MNYLSRFRSFRLLKRDPGLTIAFSSEVDRVLAAIFPERVFDQCPQNFWVRITLQGRLSLSPLCS
jgi:hypothetical protein